MTVAEKLAKINEIKQKSLKAIQDKGGNISSTSAFEDYPAAIRSIPQEVTSTDVDLSDYVTKAEFYETIGDINSVLDAINGEVV